MNPELRRLFPITERYTFLDHASFSPMSKPVSEAIEWLIGDVEASAGLNFGRWLARLEEVRGLAGRLIGASGSQIAFTQNTSEAVAFVANGIDWRVGDNVVSCSAEFPANIYPWHHLANRGVELKLAPVVDDYVRTEDILALIDQRTRVVALSFVQYATGQRMDLPTIGRYCRDNGVLFFVDAIQGLGALKLNVEENYIDALATNSHKFLLGPGGCGILYLSPDAMQLVSPSVVGWLSVENWLDAFAPNLEYKLDQPLIYRSTAARFEPGSLNMAGIFGLGGALDLILSTGVEAIEEHLICLGDYLCDGLAELGYHVVSPRAGDEKSAIICCTHPKHGPEALHRHLLSRQVVVAQRCGRLRISPHCYNTVEDIDNLLKALKDI